jgi:hypothetical protein
MTPRERIEAAADLVAARLGVDPESITISIPAGGTPHVCLTARQIEALLETKP